MSISYFRSAPLAIRFGLTLLILGMTFLGRSRVCSGNDNIDEALTKLVPSVMVAFKNRGFTTVGVLPFQLKTPGVAESTAGAQIQTNLAIRLERALTLFRDPDQPVDVVFDALKQARESDPNAHYLTAQGRVSLFMPSYSLPISAQRQKIDCFVSGIVEASSDWSEITLSLQYFTSSAPDRVVQSSPLKIKTDFNVLSQMGKGYVIPRNMIGAKGGVQGVILDPSFNLGDGAASYDEAGIGEPIQGTSQHDCPVEVTVRYGGKPVSLRKDAYGESLEFTIPDPGEGEQVTFDVRNKTDERIGVVLAVNGRSILYDLYAGNPDGLPKFVFEPQQLIRLNGVYQSSLETYQPIVGLSDVETDSYAARLPAQFAGAIQVYVYQTANAVSATSGVSSSNLSTTNGIGESQSSPTLSPTESFSRPSEANSGIASKEVSQGFRRNTGTSPIENANSNSQIPTPNSPTQIFLPTDDDFLTGFKYSSAKAIDGSNMAKGSFNSNVKVGEFSDWQELQKHIAKGLVLGPAKGMMAFQGELEKQKVAIKKLDAVQRTAVMQIRYLTLARSATDFTASK